MPKTKLHFERVPVELAKKILADEHKRKQAKLNKQEQRVSS
jgi:hypothetical protein